LFPQTVALVLLLVLLLLERQSWQQEAFCPCLVWVASLLVRSGCNADVASVMLHGDSLIIMIPVPPSHLPRALDHNLHPHLTG
jgi:hypothetical protein